MNKPWLLILMGLCGYVSGQSYIKGEATLSPGIAWDSNNQSQSAAHLRYIPTWSAAQPGSQKWRLDTELAVVFTASYASYTEDFISRASWHRAWLRLTSQRFEGRLGLQKITFGQAKLFRPLAWFDTLDPRDPRQFTTGVSGLRLRYDFPNNAGIWVWSVYDQLNIDFELGNFLETITADDQRPHTGLRLVYPLGPGEIGLSTDVAEVNGLNGEKTLQQRIGIDGFWDVTVGAWFEYEHRYLHTDSVSDWAAQLTVGSDYTFGIGNGVTVTGELYTALTGDNILDGDQLVMGGLMAAYPLTIMDYLNFFAIYSPDYDLGYHYLSWQRTWDNWLVQCSLFTVTGNISPVTATLLNSAGRRGIQLTIIFNH